MKIRTPASVLSAQDQFGLRLANRLGDSTATLPHDISERLRAARVQAVAQFAASQQRPAVLVQANQGAAILAFGKDDGSLWSRVAGILPILVLLVGLVVMNVVTNENRASELADLDSAILTDDLPPSAYTDPGFAQFLRSRLDNQE